MITYNFKFMCALIGILCTGIAACTRNNNSAKIANTTNVADSIYSTVKRFDSDTMTSTSYNDTSGSVLIEFCELDTKLKYGGDTTITQNSLKKITPAGWEIITYDKGPITNFSDSCLVVIFKTNVVDSEDEDCFKRCLSIFQIINGDFFLKKQSFNSIDVSCIHGMAGTSIYSETSIELYVNGIINIDYDVDPLHPSRVSYGFEDGEWWLLYDNTCHFSACSTEMYLYDANAQEYQHTFSSDCEEHHTSHWEHFPFRKVHMGESLDFSNHSATETVDSRFSVCSLFTMEGYLHFIRKKWLKDATKILTEKGTINNYGWSESSLFDTDFHILERNTETGKLSRIGTNLIQIELQPGRYWESDKCEINYDINTLYDDLSEDGKRFLSQDWGSMSEYERDANERRFKYSLPYRCFVFGKLFGKYSFYLAADYTNPDEVTGFYFYENKEIPIQLGGKLDDGKLILTETIDNQITGYWELNKISYRNSYWYNADKSKKCEIEVEYIERTNDN